MTRPEMIEVGTNLLLFLGGCTVGFFICGLSIVHAGGAREEAAFRAGYRYRQLVELGEAGEPDPADVGSDWQRPA